MTPPYRGGRRALDGPMRRVTPPPLALRIDDEPVSPEPEAPAVEVAPEPVIQEAPVFAYHKLVRHKFPVVRWLRRVGLALVVLIVVAGGYLGFKTVRAASHIIVHSGGGFSALADIFHPNQLKGTSSGRVNILVLGIGGLGHDGANLSDTMMLWSINTKTKQIAMISIPRDMYVDVPGYGYGKINSANSEGGPALSEQVVEKVTGVPIDYYAVLDFSGFKQAVDAVGGVDINVPTPLVDPYFPCDDGTKYANDYCPINFKVGFQHMDGERALEYSRSRETTSDFARAARQQAVILALRQKALTLSTLSNPIKLGNLIDAVGGHLKTDMQIGDMEQLASIAKGLNPSSVTQKVIDETGSNSLLVDATNTIPGAGSIELPRAGEFNYSVIQSFVQNIFTSGSMAQENASVSVENGSGVNGLAASATNSLSAAGVTVDVPTNAPSLYPQTVLYDYTDGKKPYTISYLESRFGVKATVTAPPSPTTAGAVTPDIRIILGQNYQSTQSSQ